ncbi:MAG TPA: DUF2806 domain-containing protein [Anaerolineales bacterium]|nr:DUF2806 domain-containing protein [Anaerolineales bacterium]HNE05090.1 DUF2806 domain-containing protein [Anaerolineales bacterium]HNM37225.1 DUF2806 domain-containing protein [Anaerolineales bacterium]HNO94647.1 DUF2806 domain-containing protein [Anaerolineales bacterium]
MSDNNLPLLDIGKLSEPATKLIQVVADAVGVIYEPTRIKRKAKADAEAEIIKTKAKLQSDTLKLRAKKRKQTNELKQQKNIESIIEKSIPQLPESVSSQPVDDDWVVQFFNFAQDVGNDEMQVIWARLLAGEVANPGSYSLRALHAIRMLNPTDAIYFAKFCNYLWDRKEYFFTEETQKHLDKHGLSDYVIFHLKTLGLITTELDFPLKGA